MTRHPRTEVLVVGAVAVLAPLAFSRALIGGVTAAKWPIVMAGAVALLALWAHGTIKDRSVRPPTNLAVWLGVAAALGIALGVLANGVGWAGWWGEEARANGALLYLGAAAALLAIVAGAPVQEVRALRTALVAVGGVVALHGLLQYAGADPLDMPSAFGPVVATMGNPNFASAILGIAVPLVASLALERRQLQWRSTVGALALGLLVVASLSGSVQGPIVGVVGLGVLLVAWLLEHGGRVQRIGLAAAAGGGAVGLTLGLTGLGGVGPLSGLSNLAAVGPRLLYWETAWAMFRAEPLTGVGVGRFSAHYREFRPPEGATEYESTLIADSAHSVPLDIAAQAGLLGLVPYVAFVVGVGVALVVGLRRTQGPQRLLLGGVGGAWAAYQVQSLVSIDVPALAVWHWVLAGMVLALSGTVRTREFGSSEGGGRPRRRQRSRPREVITVAVTAAIVLVGAWAATVPLRAERAAAEGVARIQTGDLDRGGERLEHAEQLIGSSGRYQQERADALATVGELDAALDAHSDALDADPRRFPSLVGSARIADELGEHELADEMWRRIMEIERAQPDLVGEAVEHWLDRGDDERANALLDRSARLGVLTPELEALRP
ncbi:O-antigen ligase domain-containing protein [Egibacter rhizosphaerae]|uniref:O-antigen ligase domain-containing protein n=1 Tax=Egibacter rhizosphaerae TaxID=1670831 RepID=A0A411YHL8_9ACTN|nr:O-antigen ligase family protein [Egibacter rhizosphaerae]QBI20740.1 O-antigen ligase domain-containing protein [Egibacter rhizosphaerae]